ncbi:sensor histidine kinase [Gordonia rhizosphera]|nr:histidine kinase [Gordonia rhizosphera]
MCRRWPHAALAAATAVFIVYGLVVGDFNPALQLPIMVCVYYLVTERSPLWSAVVVTGLVVLVWIIAVATTSGHWIGPNRLGTVAYILLAAAVGAVSHTRRAYLEALESRARLAERMREDEARQRVAAERLRIAQDLHDITAHHLSLMHMQIAVALRLLHTRPDEAAEILGRLQDTARAALDETKAAVGMLRGGDESGDLAPTPGLRDLAELIDAHRKAGMRIDVTTTGVVVDLPPAIDLTAYRIVQEALTNAARYGAGGEVRLDLAYGLNTLTISVANTVAATVSTRARPQFGIIGTEERARSVGGSVTTRRDGTEFQAVSRLPLHPVGESWQGTS